MVTCTIRVSERHEESSCVSIQQEHVELYIKGQLCSLIVCRKDGTFLREYKDHDLAKLIGSAISRGRRKGVNFFTNDTEFYFLGDR